MPELDAAIQRLGVRDPSRSEASIQSDIRLVLLLADLGLEDHDLAVDLEVPAAGGRIDILVGRTVIEVKRDLTKPGVAEAALVQLGGYLTTRLKTAGGWHVGILTDGVRWQFVQLGETGEPQTVGSLDAGPEGHDLNQLLAWLRAVVGLTPPVPPCSRSPVPRDARLTHTLAGTVQLPAALRFSSSGYSYTMVYMPHAAISRNVIPNDFRRGTTMEDA